MAGAREPKERVDALLVERGYYPSREKAKAAIMAGLVWIGQERVEKAGTKVPRDAALTVKGAPHPYVSRGGLKLEKAIRAFGIDMAGRVVLDVGASTGGFTDCALRHGAALVYAVDVGYNQLDWSLRRDERVRVMERTNFRLMTPDRLDGPRPDMAVIDVSFISLKLILPVLATMIAPGGGAVALVKPQFEAGREQVGKSGVVRDPAVHRQVLGAVLACARSLGFQLKGLTYSPITGGEGNIEFLAYWRFGGAAGGPDAGEPGGVGGSSGASGESSGGPGASSGGPGASSGGPGESSDASGASGDSGACREPGERETEGTIRAVVADAHAHFARES